MPAKVTADRPRRADARRNRERLLEAARREFARSGVDVPLAAVARAAEEAGPIDILVNSAAVVTVGPTAEQDVASYDSAFDVNVRAPYS
jgi:NAD(P)-dependent dehydrogenase (short-subunit alcohol dehydrogenase family)